MGFLRDLSHTASNLYHKRSDDEEEDAEYLKVCWEGQRMAREGWGQVFKGGCIMMPSSNLSRNIAVLPRLPSHAAAAAPYLSTPQVRAYVHELERHLGEAHRQAARLVRHQVRWATKAGGLQGRRLKVHEGGSCSNIICHAQPAQQASALQPSV